MQKSTDSFISSGYPDLGCALTKTGKNLNSTTFSPTFFTHILQNTTNTLLYYADGQVGAVGNIFCKIFSHGAIKIAFLLPRVRKLCNFATILACSKRAIRQKTYC